MVTASRAWLALSLAGSLVAPSARATECAVPAGMAPSLARVPAEVRLGFLRRELATAARRASAWAWSWAALYAGGTALEFGLSAAVSREARIDYWVGGATSAIGLASLLVLPPRSPRDQRWLEARIARAPADADPCALLAEAERLVARDAAGEEAGQSPLLHAANLLLNIAAGLVIGAVGDRWPSALLQIFGGAAIGELQLLTQPTLSVQALRRYRAGDLAPRAAPVAIAPSVSRDSLGLSVALSF